MENFLQAWQKIDIYLLGKSNSDRKHGICYTIRKKALNVSKLKDIQLMVCVFDNIFSDKIAKLYVF